MNPFRAAFLGIALGCAAVAPSAADRPELIRKWDIFEREFKSPRSYENPLQEVRFQAEFTSPSGQSRTVDGFWDGGKDWVIRFSPNEVGRWTYKTTCSDTNNSALMGQEGTFTCTAAWNKNRFSKHGPVRVSFDGRSLMHEDLTPFFWQADTAWNGALLSSESDWNHYIDARRGQGFNAVQWVTTQWRAAPDGRRGSLPYGGTEIIHINPQFFRALDQKVEALNNAGMLSVPVLLWAHPGSDRHSITPGFALPEAQAILLARYMVARWGAHDVIWILGGDGDYRGEKAAKWRRIGRAVFGGQPHAPVVMHPGGQQWVMDEFLNENWLDIIGYQSGHGVDKHAIEWLVSGPPSQDWKIEPHRPFINLEPPYEYHIAYKSGQRISPDEVRRAAYWSLLVAPTAGVSYGGHGVWGWDSGKTPPTDHPSSGVPLPWKVALEMPGAEQMTHLSPLFNGVKWWNLQPAPKLLAKQPGHEDPSRFIAVSRSNDLRELLAYTPKDRAIVFTSNALPEQYGAYWFNPRSGERFPANGDNSTASVTFTTPQDGDWVLVVQEVVKRLSVVHQKE